MAQKEATAKQLVQLNRNFSDLLSGVAGDHDNAQRLIENFNLTQAIANGGLDDVLIVKTRCRVTIDYGQGLAQRYQAVGFEPDLDDPTFRRRFDQEDERHRHWGQRTHDLELVSFIKTPKGLQDNLMCLKNHGLEPATTAQCIAFAAAHPPAGWSHRDLLIFGLGSTGSMYNKPIGPLLFAPDERHQPGWRFDHFWHDTDNSFPIHQKCWLLAVRP